MLTLFFGTDELNFQMTTTNPNAPQKTRFFTRFSQAEEEVIDARVYVGSTTATRTALLEHRVSVSRTGSLRATCDPSAIRALEHSRTRTLIHPIGRRPVGLSPGFGAEGDFGQELQGLVLVRGLTSGFAVPF